MAENKTNNSGRGFYLTKPRRQVLEALATTKSGGLGAGGWVVAELLYIANKLAMDRGTPEDHISPRAVAQALEDLHSAGLIEMVGEAREPDSVQLLQRASVFALTKGDPELSRQIDAVLFEPTNLAEKMDVEAFLGSLHTRHHQEEAEAVFDALKMYGDDDWYFAEQLVEAASPVLLKHLALEALRDHDDDELLRRLRAVFRDAQDELDEVADNLAEAVESKQIPFSSDQMAAQFTEACNEMLRTSQRISEAVERINSLPESIRQATAKFPTIGTRTTVAATGRTEEGPSEAVGEDVEMDESVEWVAECERLLAEGAGMGTDLVTGSASHRPNTPEAVDGRRRRRDLRNRFLHRPETLTEQETQEALRYLNAEQALKDLVMGPALLFSIPRNNLAKLYGMSRQRQAKAEAENA